MSEEETWFLQAQWATKYWAPQVQRQIAEATRGTPMMPRDVMTMIMAGRFNAIQMADGRIIYSMAAVQDISESLDILSQTKGSMLYRNNTLWQGVPPGSPGQVLTFTGLNSAPAWTGAGGGGGVGYQPLPQPLFQMEAGNVFVGNAWAGIPIYIDQTLSITGIRLAVFDGSAGHTAVVGLYTSGATGRPDQLVAQGTNPVTLTDNTVVELPFDAPPTLPAGGRYYLGPLILGAGNVNLAYSAFAYPQFHFATSLVILPSTAPAVTFGRANNGSYWSYI
jgi:hypothetical protein